MVEIASATIDWEGAEQPIAVTNIDVLAAMAETDPSETHGPKQVFIKFEKQHYPVGQIVTRAIAHATGVEREGFSPEAAGTLVNELGFQTISPGHA